jgi:hypothetical protein
MEIIKQGSVFCSVNQVGGQLESKTVLMSSEFEAHATLIVDAGTYKINQAEYEISKAHYETSIGKHSLPDLVGTEAYFGINRALVRLPELNRVKRLRPLLQECVKGLIQAETYVYIERGYDSEAAYEDYWVKREKNGCRYYSSFTDDLPGWFEYVGSYRREGNLFNRYKNYKLIDKGFGFQAQGTLNDSYHEMTADISFERITGKIRQCELSVFRAPGEACFENVIHGERFLKQNLYTLTGKQIHEIVGGALGCYHLNDLVADLINMVRDCGD